jgi:hypothetical protein
MLKYEYMNIARLCHSQILTDLNDVPTDSPGMMKVASRPPILAALGFSTKVFTTWRPRFALVFIPHRFF